MDKVCIKSINLKNFKTFKNQKLEIPENDFILITGDNQDIEGADSNGSGKSALILAIAWCLTGKVLSDEPVLNFNEDQCEVQVGLSSGWFVIRSTNGKTVKLTLKKSSVSKGSLPPVLKEIHTDMTPTEKQNEIYKILGIKIEKSKFSFFDFMNSIYLDPDGVNVFTDNSIAEVEKFKFFAKFYNIETYDLASILAKTEVDSLAITLREYEQEIAVRKSYLDKNSILSIDDERMTHEEYLNRLLSSKKQKQQMLIKLRQEELDLRPDESLINDFNKAKINVSAKESDILNTRDQIEITEKSIDKLTKDIGKLKPDIAKIKFEISAQSQHYLTGKTDLNAEKRNCTETLRKLDFEKSEIDRDLTVSRLNIKNPLTCPNCKTDLLFEKGSLIVHDTNAYAAIKKQIIELESKLQKIQDKIEDVNENLKAIAASANYLALVKECNLKQKQLEDYKNRLIYLNESLSKYEKELVEFKTTYSKIDAKLNTKDTEKWTDTLNQIDSTEQIIEEIQTEIGSTNTEIETIKTYIKDINEYEVLASGVNERLAQYSFWVSTFKTLKAIVLQNKFLILNQITTAYLEKLGMPYLFDITTTGEYKSSSNIKFEINIFITDEYGVRRDLKTFSKGERTRIVATMLLALKSTKSSNIRFLIMDEYLNMLDETGELNMLNLLNELNYQSLAVTNSTSLQNNWPHRKLLVTRKNGISSAKFTN